MSKLYGWLAGLVAILAVVGVIYGKGRLDANHAAKVASIQEDLAVAREVIAKEQKARENDAIMATEAAKRKAALELKITGLEGYVATLDDRDLQCLSGADTERLRDLWAK